MTSTISITYLIKPRSSRLTCGLKLACIAPFHPWRSLQKIFKCPKIEIPAHFVQPTNPSRHSVVCLLSPPPNSFSTLEILELIVIQNLEHSLAFLLENFANFTDFNRNLEVVERFAFHSFRLQHQEQLQNTNLDALARIQTSKRHSLFPL